MSCSTGNCYALKIFFHIEMTHRYIVYFVYNWNFAAGFTSKHCSHSVHNESVLVYFIVWQLAGDKPLPVPITNQFDWHIHPSMGLTVFISHLSKDTDLSQTYCRTFQCMWYLLIPGTYGMYENNTRHYSIYNDPNGWHKYITWWNLT